MCCYSAPLDLKEIVCLLFATFISGTDLVPLNQILDFTKCQVVGTSKCWIL
jgi:hypothetical protein